MKCPYSDPTIQQCLSCPLPDCVPPALSSEDEIKMHRHDIDHKFYSAHRKQRKANSATYYATHREIILAKRKEKAASLRQQQSDR